MPDHHNWFAISIIMIISGLIFYHIEVISRIHYFSINREIIAWSHELDAIGTLWNNGRSWKAPEHKDQKLKKVEAMN